MIVRATSDLHLSQTTAPYVFAALEELRADAEKHCGPTMLLGDIFDQARTVHVPTWQKLRFVLQTWPEDVYVLAGNHDQYDRPFGTVLGGLQGGNCRVIEVPQRDDLGWMIPWVGHGNFKTAWQQTRCKHLDGVALPMVWCHEGFKGAYMNRMVRDKTGTEYSQIPPDHTVIAGHYHMPHGIGRIIYCGSPYQTSFAEEGQDKGWLRWSDIRASQVPQRIRYEVGAPRHHTIEWDGEQPPEVPEAIKPGDKIRIRTPLSRLQIKDRHKQLDAVGLLGVQVISISTPAVTEAVDQSGSPEQAAVTWMTWRAADDQDLPDPGMMDEFAREHGLWESL